MYSQSAQKWNLVPAVPQLEQNAAWSQTQQAEKEGATQTALIAKHWCNTEELCSKNKITNPQITKLNDLRNIIFC